MKNLMLSFFFGCSLAACGSHQSNPYGFATGGELQVVEKPVEPVDVLTEALRAGNIEIISGVLSQGWPVDQPLRNGRTALIEAVVWNRISVVEFLLAQGADVQVTDSEGLTAIDHAQDQPALLRLLEPKGDAETEELFLAVRENRFNDVRRMISEGVDPNVRDAGGETPLTLAVTLNLEFVVRILLQPGSGADVNLRNGIGQSPLELSRKHGLSRIERMLIQRGAKD